MNHYQIFLFSPTELVTSELLSSGLSAIWELPEPHCLATGVPHGSALGQLLFSVYTLSNLLLMEECTVSIQISVCLKDITMWINEGQPQVNLWKIEALDHSSPSKAARKLGLLTEFTIPPWSYVVLCFHYGHVQSNFSFKMCWEWHTSRGICDMDGYFLVFYLQSKFREEIKRWTPINRAECLFSSSHFSRVLKYS